MVKIQSLAQFPVDHLSHSVMPSLVLPLCVFAAFDYSEIVSSLSPHDVHLLFCCVLSIFALTRLFLMALFCPAIRRASVFLLRFPFNNHVQLFSYSTSSVCPLKYPYSCFSFYFCFLVYVVYLSVYMLPSQQLIGVISLSLLFLLLPLSPCIDASTQSSVLANALPPFLDTFILCHFAEVTPCA